MDYTRLGYHIAAIAFAVVCGILLAGSSGPLVGLIYLAILGLIGVNLDEIFEMVYFHFAQKALG